ncbi:MAG: hypothetical protein ACRBM6_37490 [Geminicoccales bacterium]
MANYTGLGIGLELTAVCIMDQDGDSLYEAMTPGGPASLSKSLEEADLPFKRIGMEACPLSQRRFDGLVKAGFPAICVESRRLTNAVAKHSDRRARLMHRQRTVWSSTITTFAHRSSKAAMTAMTRKSDRHDARGIAEVMRTGWFRPVHVKSKTRQEIRMLLTCAGCRPAGAVL